MLRYPFFDALILDSSTRNLVACIVICAETQLAYGLLGMDTDMIESVHRTQRNILFSDQAKVFIQRMFAVKPATRIIARSTEPVSALAALNPIIIWIIGPLRATCSHCSTHRKLPWRCSAGNSVLRLVHWPAPGITVAPVGALASSMHHCDHVGRPGTEQNGARPQSSTMPIWSDPVRHPSAPAYVARGASGSAARAAVLMEHHRAEWRADPHF